MVYEEHRDVVLLAVIGACQGLCKEVFVSVN